jgi:outer membrane protein TolC
LRRAEAEAEAEGAGAELAAMRLELAAEAALSFEEYALVHEALAINAEHRRLLDDLREVATARYAAGLAPQQDPLQAETEGAELLVREAELEAEREVLTARLNAFLHRTPGLPLPPPAPRAAAERELPDPATLEAVAVAVRPEVRRRQAEVRARRAALDLARLARRPDVAVMGAYNSMWDMPEHRWMAGVSVELPLWRRRTAAAQREAEARLAAAEAALRHAEDEARGEVRQTHARLAESLRVATIYESRLLPPARDQVAAALAALTAGQASALTVLEAERGLRRAELGYAEALAALARRRVELDRAAGRLPGGLDLELEGAAQ